jgi:hypothetical protein
MPEKRACAKKVVVKDMQTQQAKPGSQDNFRMGLPLFIKYQEGKEKSLYRTKTTSILQCDDQEVKGSRNTV